MQGPTPEQVSFWDTLTLSGGERFQVMAAALAAKAGWALEAVRERLAQIRAKTEVIYTLDTLEYLARGVKAIAGALLNLKPVIRVDADGRYSTVGTGRTIGKSITAIGEHLQNKYGRAPLWVTVVHGRFAEKAEMLASQLKAKLKITQLEVMRISPVLDVHTGPGIVGAAVVPVECVQGLM